MVETAVRDSPISARSPSQMIGARLAPLSTSPAVCQGGPPPTGLTKPLPSAFEAFPLHSSFAICLSWLPWLQSYSPATAHHAWDPLAAPLESFPHLPQPIRCLEPPVVLESSVWPSGVPQAELGFVPLPGSLEGEHLRSSLPNWVGQAPQSQLHCAQPATVC